MTALSGVAAVYSTSVAVEQDVIVVDPFNLEIAAYVGLALEHEDIVILEGIDRVTDCHRYARRRLKRAPVAC